MKFKRTVRFFFQRLFRGWDDSQTWSMDHSLAKLILPRLKKFQELKNGYPSSMTDAEWTLIIDEMIWGFEWFATGKQWESENLAEHRRAEKSIELFAKHYQSLWW